ncbi:transposase (plasmid) [Clostridium botulinum]|uniref:Transposase n=1 Tax=Clostridium botulinum C/D str. DC5 TaxID=1443128 RepID=A0A0A0I160_CLOBO|nr:RNA-guided endonuclease TnpB family protein [Clostridium botulinum]KGM93365.1 transposase [Clostridium botulinum C/D str. DC5]KOC56952.1 transposase [Clostridium botulinum]KOC57427.1 transposase [Clostridium botulinum]MCD3232669.1 IS200/IS605 family element transposase accessory protein TnpB [Clostridium botulinum D/C]MCD3238401.1 IS200/IS605 family element transposase accessory protein TnpB [Clostridium botulinum D/C]
MIKAVKIRLFPTKEQEVLMFKSCGVARFTYNWGLNRWNEIYKSGEKPNKIKVRTEFNNTLKKDDNYKWLKEVSGQVTAKSFDDLKDGFDRFFKGLSGYPKFKTKKKSKKSFYVRYDSIKFKDHKVNFEKIGKVKYNTNYKIPNLSKYNNPRCHFDGKYWYLTLGFEHYENQVKLNKDLSIGIDLGVKDLAVVNCLDKPIKNINKSVKVRKLKKRLKRLQRQVSRKYLMNKQNNKFIKTNNIIKLEHEIRLIYRKLNNIRNNHIHQTTNKIIKLKPYRVVMEDLNVQGMLKNKHLSKAIQEQCFYEFIRQMKYKCEWNSIKFIQVDRFYPSSKTCSCCGNIKKDLKLSDRVYKCYKCGLAIDRDKNASINLSNYKIA